MSLTLHQAGPMVDMAQFCTRCGVLISDYRNAAWPSDSGPPMGFSAGPVTIGTGNPRVSMAGELPGAVPCTPHADA